MDPEYYRREAGLMEEAARSITLSTDKESLLAKARALRERADALEASPQHQGASTRIFLAPNSTRSICCETRSCVEL